MTKTGLYPYMTMMLIATFCLTITSCLHDQFPDEGQGIIIVSLNGVETRAAGEMLFTEGAGDEAINKVRILVFTGDYLEKNRLFTSGSADFNNPFTLEVTTGTKEIYVVANESDAIKAQLESVTTKNGLTTMLADEITSSLAPPLLMTGYVPDVQVIAVEAPARNSTTVQLTRIAAKITLQFKKADDNKDIKITKVSLLSNTEKSTLFPASLSTAVIGPQTYWDLSIPFSTPLELQTTLSGIDAIGEIYLYENLTGSENDKTHATQLVVEALYNDIPTKYRVYINENIASPGTGTPGDPGSSVTDPNDHHYKIKRNHHYKLTGNIINLGEFDGLLMQTEVLPWDRLSSEQLFDRIFKIDPYPEPQDNIIPVGTDGKVSFTFNLLNPYGATWVANLTNLADFEFEGVNQGDTNNEATITIKAKNPPAENERTTEFYINVGYYNNWVEIPLLEGSALTGENNRIIISQPAVVTP